MTTHQNRIATPTSYNYGETRALSFVWGILRTILARNGLFSRR